MAETRVWPAPERSKGKQQQERSPEPNEDYKPVVHVEAKLRDGSVIQPKIVQNILYAALVDSNLAFQPDSFLSDDFRQVDLLDKHIHSAWVELDALDHDLAEHSDHFSFASFQIHVHVYESPHGSYQQLGLSPENEEEEEDGAHGDDGTSAPAASLLQLPDASLERLWQNLIFDSGVKETLLTYIQTTMLFSDVCVDSNVITYNRVVLLHGPPGTGKTSLCRALSQKLAIRLGDSYSSTRLVEIHAHSLFSKWFSESGKMVQKLFDSIQQLLRDDPDAFMVVLVDEVESLTAAREGVVGGKEPSDALRVVNALLTQLDRLKQHPNVLVMTTSNLTNAIDDAFIDRADIKQYIGLPSAHAVYAILRTCLAELQCRGLVQQGPVSALLDWKTLHTQASHETREGDLSRQLASVASMCKNEGLSGRFLRRLPILAHARSVSRSRRRDLPTWISAFALVLEEESQQRSLVDNA